MLSIKAAYLPPDRLQALISGTDLPQTAEGSTLFADISGFTSVTERFRQIFGARRGAEELAVHLNRVYDALITEVDRHGGSIMGFAGDAITCWFNGATSAVRAVACGFSLLEAMHRVEEIVLPEAESVRLGLKVVITTGTTKRFVVGDPKIQLIDALAGATVALIATGEDLAQRGELLADGVTVAKLGDTIQVREWRGAEQQRFAVLAQLETLTEVPGFASTNLSTLSDNVILPWMLPALNRQLLAGLGEFQIELRPVTALFLRFSTIAYDEDPQALEKLDQLMRLVQGIVNGYEGNVLQLTIGDKGSYLYAAFGAPYVHEDDPARALNAAIDIRDQAARLGYLDPVQIGISRGIMRTGAYGGDTRRTYGVLGDEVNLAARLMSNAQPGTILISESMLEAKLDDFDLQSLSPIQVKGKAQPIRIFQVNGRRDRSFEERFYTTPLVGRDDAFTTLKDSIQPIFEGRHAGVIFVYGEPGIGKSRLAFEAQKWLQQEHNNITWFTGQADALNRAPLSAFTYFLRPYFGYRRERDAQSNLIAFETAFDNLLALTDEANWADLNLYRSYLAGMLALVIPGSPYEIADAKTRIDNGIAAIKAWVRTEARRQPLVLHLEDAQWLDASSIQAVQQLTYDVNDLPLALLLTSRYNDDGTPFTISNLYSVPVHSIDLNQLSDDGVRAVAAAVLKGAISDQLAGFIQSRAEGNPFFAEQLTLELKERGALTQQGADWDVRTDAAAEVPEGVNSVLIARLDRLAAQVKAVVQTAAVLGREFDVLVLSRMLREVDTPAIREAEHEAIWTALDEIRFLFRHALLRDAAYAMQAQERLRILHRLAAETIEAIYPDDDSQLDVLLEHWHSAGVADKVLYYTVPVCERLVNVVADYARAEHLSRQGLLMGDTPYRMTLLRLLGDAMRGRGEYDAAVEHYEAFLADGNAEPLQRIGVLQGMGEIRMVKGDYPTATTFFEEAMALAREHQNSGRVAQALRSLGNLAFRQSQHDQAHTYHSESLRIYREMNNRPGIADVLLSLSNVASIKGDNATAKLYLEESLAIAIETGYRRLIGHVIDNLGTVALQQGDFETAQSNYERALSIWRTIGNRNGIGATLGNLAVMAYRQGNLFDARRYSEASLSERRAIGDRRGIANAISIVGAVAFQQNDYPAAQRYTEESMEMQRSVNDRWGVASSLGNLAEIVKEQGKYSLAEAYAAEAVTLSRQLEQPLGIADNLFIQADTAYEQGDVIRSRALHEETLNIRREINDQRGLPMSLVALASLDRDNGAFVEAESQLMEAIPLLRTLDLPMLAAASAIMAVIRHRLGQPDTVVNHDLREALTLAQAKNVPRYTFVTIIEAAPLLLERQHYTLLAEMLGMISAQTPAYTVIQAINRLLDDLRPHLDTTALNAAFDRGKTMDLDTAIEHLLRELS